jgi:hypothetical protein
MICGICGLPVSYYRGYWWDDGDDFMCPDGETEHGETEFAVS